MNKSESKISLKSISLYCLMICVLSACTSEQNTESKSKILNINYRNLISRADITLDKPVPRKEAGLPVGNGQMGSLIWTTPTTMHFQVNRGVLQKLSQYT